MQRIVFEDVHELSAEMLHDAIHFSDCVSAVCHYEIATYFVYIVNGCVSCEPAFRSVSDGGHDKYLEMGADIMYVHQDCNSKVLKYIDCDKIFEFSVEEFDESDDCEEECLDNSDDITTHHSDSVTVSRDKFGNPTGFSKSWFRDDGDGITQYSSYSYYCNDEDRLRSLARDLDIEL